MSDTGCGMTPEMQERLFKPFEQESATTAQKHGGSGLGLSIAKNLVDMMHGAIHVNSEKGKGTSFIVDFPFGATDHEVAEADEKAIKNLRVLVVDDDKSACDYTSIIMDRIGVDYDVAVSGAEALEMLETAYEADQGYDICFVDWKMPEISGADVIREIREKYDDEMLIIVVSAYDVNEVEDEAKAAGANMFIPKPLFQSTVFNLLMQLSGGKYTKHTGNQAQYDFTGHKVLLAEDNALNSEIAMELLHMVQMEVDHAENGQRAVEMFEQSKPGTYDLILMDVQMPVMDGMEATKAIRASSHSEAKVIPIFAMTANAFNEDVAAALAAGMNGHLAKPIDPAIMYETIQKAINTKQ
ncbi:MAG: response regulator [Lachnospiraceae bacterium]|nr:response regulator [Lachnospiraceae bacterium]